MYQALIQVTISIISLWSFLIFAWAISSWFSPNPKARWFIVLRTIVEPILYPFQKLIPNLGPFDFSTLAALIVLRLISEILASRIVS